MNEDSCVIFYYSEDKPGSISLVAPEFVTAPNEVYLCVARALGPVIGFRGSGGWLACRSSCNCLA